MKNLISYLKSSYDELMNNVTWPSWSELQSSAALVIVASLIFAVIVMAMDQSFQFVLEQVYKLMEG
ncbi:MAG: preprotein translocase subunit SecE [Bacteroidia bacterium]|nr:preprotein translocase subunit SecE [Bacteroidia bacterium]